MVRDVLVSYLPENTTSYLGVVWTNASSLAAGVVVQLPCGDVIEDACWLRTDESAHINMAELDAAIRGVNSAVAWGMRDIELRTDSATVHRWVDDALTGRARLRTKAHGEMLIRRRVDIIRQLASELSLDLSVVLVRSTENRADVLTRVPREWLSEAEHARASDGSTANIQPAVRAASVAERDAGAAAVAERGAGLSAASVAERDAGAAAVGGVSPGENAVQAASGAEDGVRALVRGAHERAGHPGVRRTLYFARRDVSRDVTRAMARAVVETCDTCRSIDPAPVRWRHGSLSVAVTWQRLAIDVTHYQGLDYLTVIDCGPSRFSVWRHLRRAGAAETTAHLDLPVSFKSNKRN